MSDVYLNLQKFINKLLPEAINNGLEVAGQYGENKAKENITAYNAVDSSDLKISITHVVNKSEQEVDVGTPLEYAPEVHNGTGIYKKDGDGRKVPWRYQDEDGNWHTTSGMKPRPFLQDVADYNMDDIFDAFKRGASL